jgi:type III pantothenate kinase
MDINLMVINAGNTRVAIGVFVGGELQHVARVGASERENWPGVIAEAWKLIEKADSPAIAGASVNPGVAEPIEHQIEKTTGTKVQWIGRDIDLPMRVLTDAPAETGADRVANIAAAYEQMQKACVVVDAGTAITVDCCNDQGEFLGGAIAPGVMLQLEALHSRTAKLPMVAPAAPESAFGRNTADAIRNGVFHGVRGMVKELVETYATELGNWPEIIATGGDAHLLFDNWELIHAVSPDLTLYGIALAYVNHQVKHG